MGNISNVCCQGQKHYGNLDILLSSTFNFEPSAPIKILNSNILQRLGQLSEEPLHIDQSQYTNLKFNQPQRQIIKNFIYEGTWKDNLPEGAGKILFQNSQLFEGEFKQGSAEGKGRYFFANGDYFEGNVKNNKAEGRGKYVGQFIKYDGYWSDSKPTVGNYIFNKDHTKVFIVKQNEGNIEWTNGNKYKGEITNLTPNGTGKMEFDNGSTYDGDWKDGVFDGYGTFKWDNGQYVGGIKHGKGEFVYNDRRRYEGEWRNGKQNGNGELFEDGKVIFKGVFEDGVPVLEKGGIENFQLKMSNVSAGSEKIRMYDSKKTEGVVIPKTTEFVSSPLKVNDVRIEPKRMGHGNDEYYNTYEVK